MRLRNLHLQKIFTTQPEKALSNLPQPCFEQGRIEGSPEVPPNLSYCVIIKFRMGICVPRCAFVNRKRVPLQASSHWNAFIYSVFSHQDAHKLLTGLHWSLEPGSHAETSACVTSTGLLWTQLCFSQSPQHPHFYRSCLIHSTYCYCSLGTPRAVPGQPSSGCALHPLQLTSFLVHERTCPYVRREMDLWFFFWPDSNLRS